ncbi:protein associated with UVRAG as autophagy enhancer isoform X2 [Lissotriton helveticus]
MVFTGEERQGRTRFRDRLPCFKPSSGATDACCCVFSQFTCEDKEAQSARESVHPQRLVDTMSALAVTMSVNASNVICCPSTTRRRSFTQTPKMDIPSDKFSRPAVIGLSGSCGSYPNSASAIKDILMSVLSTSDGVKPPVISSETASPGTDFQDRAIGYWEDTSDGELNEDYDSDADGTDVVCRAQEDIRFTRNMASWDNSENNSFTYLPHNSPVHLTRFTDDAVSQPTVCKAQTDVRFTRNRASWDNAYSNSFEPMQRNSPVNHRRLSKRRLTPSLNSFSRRRHSMVLKPHSFDDEGFIASITSQVTSPSVDLEMAFGSFSSPDLPGLRVKTKHQSHVSSFKKLTAPPQSFRTSHTSLTTTQDTCTFQRRSQSFPTIQQAVDSGLTPNNDSLIRSHSSQGLFRPTVDLEKENEHFYVADLIIAAFEKLKCKLQSPPPEHVTVERVDLFCAFPSDIETHRYGRRKTQSESAASIDSGYEGCAVLQHMQTSKPIPEQDGCTCSSDVESDDEYVVLELEDYEKAVSVSPCPQDTAERSSYLHVSNSAEVTAQQLYRNFRKCWRQAETDCQMAAPLKGTKQNVAYKSERTMEFESSVSLVKEIKLKCKCRGSCEWAPPRFQIIFNIQPSRKRDDVVAAQYFRCAGCGTEVEPKYNRRLRYCDYLGKYFCDCCHSYAESSIPARILMKWDFSKYCVSNFAKQLIESIWLSPAFDVLSINPNLYTKVKELERVREQQEQLIHLKKMLKSCRFAESTLEKFDQVSCNLTEEQHLFSLDDIVQVKRGLLLPLLKDLVKTSVVHVQSCELCQAKGFICEFCHRSEVLFPFQTEVVTKCNVCKTCFHKRCFKSEGDCPKCQRIEARKRLLSAPTFSVEEDGQQSRPGDMDSCRNVS